MRSPERGDPGEACIFDADLFAQKPDLVVELVGLGREANTNVAAVGRPTPGVDQSVMGQGHDMDQRGLNRARPVLGGSRRIAHSRLR